MAAITPTDRSVKVADAVIALKDATADAITILAEMGADSEESKLAWANVEALGATVHRQSRLLAGKPRGG